MTKPFTGTFALFCFSLLLFACESGPGPGGRASIQGKVLVQEYNGNCTVMNQEYYAPDEEVYIIYGNDPSYSERIRTGPDGVYWFPYLQKGQYTVYAISDNCNAPGGIETIMREVVINEKQEKVLLEDIVVIR